MTRSIVLLARAPSAPGKTRLTSHLAPDVARALRTALLLDTFDVVRSLDGRILVAFTPAAACDEMESLLGGANVSFVPQRGGDIGSRMHAAILDATSHGADVVVVGSDLPTLPASHILDAFALLEAGHDLVLGPADDGGYYLIGLQSGPRAQPLPRAASLFEAIDWDAADVLAQTIAAAQRAGLDPALAPAWFDVDTVDDLARVAGDPRPDVAPRTRAWLQSFRLW